MRRNRPGSGDDAWVDMEGNGDRSTEEEEEEDDEPRERRRSNFLEASAKMVAGESATGKRERELDRKVWRQFSDMETPNIFSNLYIAEDSGFSEVGDLWYKSRWMTAGLTVCFILSNVYFIITVDFNILAGQAASGDPSDTTRTMYLVTSPISKFFLESGAHSDDMIAIFELGGLTVLLSSAVHQLCVAHAAKSERLKWFALERFFWQIVPQLSSYSAMRLLHHVSPTVFLSSLSTYVTESTAGTMPKRDVVKGWVKFIMFHLFCLIVGFDSFLVKIRAAYSSINEKHLTLTNLYGAAVFMVQVLGVVRLGSFVQQRLFVFIFAGEDAVMQPEEKAKQHVWNALLVRQIYRSMPLSKFVSLMLSFDDTDFQKLVLNERRHAPSHEPEESLEPTAASKVAAAAKAAARKAGLSAEGVC